MQLYRRTVQAFLRKQDIAMKASVISLSAALPLLAIFAAGAQQLRQPTIAPAQSGARTLPQPASPQSRSVASDPGQRSQAPSISPRGPAIDANRPVQPSTAAPATPAASPRVVDPQGRQINGAVPMGTNQVMDPKTGKVYTTMPHGDGQRIIQPTPTP
jgi:hypothetical protein